ncbi:MAG: UDP-3-O-acyl-N-acetylglucosamine deacetylase [Alphaproteobacteria bacterium]|nr:UDP-3-O-acyl-N-acetylglucosamine deacetylase [Alphaproteobacteria bacterium]
MQHTLKSPVSLSGIGLHSGKFVQMHILPAAVGHGVVFERTDISDKDNIIPALWSHVVDTRLCTVIANDDGVSVGTIEHLMAALRGCGIDNALVQIDGAEVPIMDGSSLAFVEAIEEVGTQVQDKPRKAIRVCKEVTYQEGDKVVKLSPGVVPTYKGRIEYAHPSIGDQEYSIKLVNGNFKHDLADCRTFGLLEDVEKMRAQGLALGGSTDNAIVVDGNGVMNPGGLRCHDEFIRHKLLDAIGDLSLAGGIVIGTYEGMKAGHALNNKILQALFSTPDAWEEVELYVDTQELDDWLCHAGAPVDQNLVPEPL